MSHGCCPSFRNVSAKRWVLAVVAGGLLSAWGCGSSPRTLKRDAARPETGAGGSGGGGGGRGGSGGLGGGSGGAGGGAAVDAAALDAAIDGSRPDAAVPVDVNRPDLPPVDPSGLIGHWKFDELTGTTTEDSAGSANDGQLMPGAQLVAGGFPGAMFPNRGALSLDGMMGRVVLGTNRLPDVNAAKTIAFWFNYSTLPTNTRALVSLTNGALLCGVQIGLRGMQVSVWGWGGTAALIVRAGTFPPGWHQLTYTFDGNTHSISIDGAPAVQSLVTPQSCDVTDAQVGSFAGGREHFAGLVDDLRIYRRALTAAEISVLAMGGEPTPRGRLDGGADRVADDAGPGDSDAQRDAGAAGDAGDGGGAGDAGADGADAGADGADAGADGADAAPTD